MEHPPGRKRTAQTPFRTFGLHRLPLLVQPTDTAVNDPPPHTHQRGGQALGYCLCAFAGLGTGSLELTLIPGSGYLLMAAGPGF